MITCRICRKRVDARTEAAGGEVCFDCATTTPMTWHRDGLGIRDERNRLILWAGHAKRGCSMRVSPTEKNRILPLVSAAPTAHQLVREAVTALEYREQFGSDDMNLVDVRDWLKAARAYLESVEG